MEVSSMLVFLFSSLSTIVLFQLSHSTSVVVVDGVSEWRNPTLHVGDSIIFNHKYHYKLYIFQNKIAFDLCNFTQATLLTKPNSSSFTWHPSRPGFFYYSFNNGSLSTCYGQKLVIKVSPPQPSNGALSPPPELSPIAAPPPSSGGVVSSSPAYPWPFRPRELTSPSPAPTAILPATTPSTVADKGDAIPFISSNPAVPLPTGEVDSATIRPLPISGHGRQVVGFLAVQIAVCWVVFLMLL
uniref:Putative Cupredoxin superfamily protein isoform 1 n=1 Tax=Davidia involucrata TaxID=16924 RepID=A0A5B6YHL7_DAVIN